jgi:hypothetical protein
MRGRKTVSLHGLSRWAWSAQRRRLTGLRPEDTSAGSDVLAFVAGIGVILAAWAALLALRLLL